ncbi:MAG: hypothetical protein ABI586_02725 [Candidatus Nanopelagicales bacterium]
MAFARPIYRGQRAVFIRVSTHDLFDGAVRQISRVFGDIEFGIGIGHRWFSALESIDALTAVN